MTRTGWSDYFINPRYWQVQWLFNQDFSKVSWQTVEGRLRPCRSGQDGRERPATFPIGRDKNSRARSPRGYGKNSVAKIHTLKTRFLF